MKTFKIVAKLQNVNAQIQVVHKSSMSRGRRVAYLDRLAAQAEKLERLLVRRQQGGIA